jgi:hypothetical protein
MLNRRHWIALTFSTLVIAGVGGCAAPPKPPTYKWGQVVDFEGFTFEFVAVRTVPSFTNWVNQRTVAGETFVIVDVSIVNRTGAPIPHHFQPVVRLLDAAGATYEPDLQKTIMNNMQKPGRASFGQSMNPSTPFKQEIVFDVRKQPYVVQVIAPNRARLGLAGSITTTGPYFLYDISSQQ